MLQLKRKEEEKLLGACLEAMKWMSEPLADQVAPFENTMTWSKLISDK